MLDILDNYMGHNGMGRNYMGHNDMVYQKRIVDYGWMVEMVVQVVVQMVVQVVVQVVQVNDLVDDHDVHDIQDNVKNRIVQVDGL